MNDGGPAFPRIKTASHSNGGSSDFKSADGMSLRDYFAAKALAGELANSGPTASGEIVPASMAKWSYELADAMIAEREKARTS